MQMTAPNITSGDPMPDTTNMTAPKINLPSSPLAAFGQTSLGITNTPTTEPPSSPPAIKQIVSTTPAEMNRVLLEFTTTWPNHPDPFAGIPQSKREDRQLYLAAGAHLDDPPLPPTLASKVARSLALDGLTNAELELKMSLLVRMDFHQDLRILNRMRFMSAYPLPLIVEVCQQSVILPAGTKVPPAWIGGFREQVLFWVREHQRICLRKPGLATASLCRLRQLSCGYGLMARAIMEPVWRDPDRRFTAFHDQVIATMPECDFHYTGRHPGRNVQSGWPPAAQITGILIP